MGGTSRLQLRCWPSTQLSPSCKPACHRIATTNIDMRTQMAAFPTSVLKVRVNRQHISTGRCQLTLALARDRRLKKNPKKNR